MKIVIVALFLLAILLFNYVYKNNNTVQYFGNAIAWLILVITETWQYNNKWWFIILMPICFGIIYFAVELTKTAIKLTKQTVSEHIEYYNTQIKDYTEAIDKLSKVIEEDSNNEYIDLKKSMLNIDKRELQKYQNRLKIIEHYPNKLSFFKALAITFNPRWS